MQEPGGLKVQMAEDDRFWEERLFQPLHGASHTMATLSTLGGHQPCWGSPMVDPDGWTLPPRGLALIDMESWNWGGRQGTAAQRSV